MSCKNEIGNKYGRLTVLNREPNDKSGRAMWKCKCDCGNEIIVRGTSLRYGSTQSCGCLQKEKAKQSGNNLVGQQFGRLTVIKQDNNINKMHRGKYWICKCSCGKEVTIRGDRLTSNQTKSCGCLQREKAGSNKINELGNRYGKLIVIKELPSDSQGHSKWLCKCDCGNEKIVTGTALRSGVISSCGCIKSKGETIIEQILKQEGIIYKREYSFPDLFYKAKEIPLRFDFCIFTENQKIQCLIEFQGIQHYDKNNFFYNDEIIIRDNLKREYCQNHNIPLFEIKDIKEIEQIVNQILIGSEEN